MVHEVSIKSFQSLFLSAFKRKGLKKSLLPVRECHSTGTYPSLAVLSDSTYSNSLENEMLVIPYHLISFYSISFHLISFRLKTAVFSDPPVSSRGWPMPYCWQYKKSDSYQWNNFDHVDNVAIEKLFCDVENLQVSLVLKDTSSLR